MDVSVQHSSRIFNVKELTGQACSKRFVGKIGVRVLCGKSLKQTNRKE
jgi:hypothetical protein